MVVQILTLASATITPTLLLHKTSCLQLHRVSTRAIWISSLFRAIDMSLEEPNSSWAISSYAKVCSKVTGKSPHITVDIDGRHEVKGEISSMQSISECEDLKKPSQEVQQAVGEVGFEKDLVYLKDDKKLMKLTVAELRVIMRKLGIPPTGRKLDLILALKNYSQNTSKDQNFENSNPKETESCLPEIIPNQLRNQGKKGQVKTLRISSLQDSPILARCTEGNDGKFEVTNKNSRICKKQSNNSKKSVDVTAKISSPPEETMTIQETLTKSAFQDSEVHTIESIDDGCGEKVNMLWPPETDKGLAQKKRKVMKSVHNSKIKDGIAASAEEAELNFNSERPWTMLVHKKAQDRWVAYNPTTMRPTSPTENMNMVRLISWNVNGLRALLKRKEENTFLQLAKRENFDVLCLQETKLQEKDVEQIKQGLLDGYKYSFWTCSVSKLGYSGTAVISRIKPVSVKIGLGIPNHDGEGRLITIELDRFYLVAGYVPNSGQKLERLTHRIQQWDPALSSYIKDLEQKKPVILTGDLNCAHEEIDIYNPDGNRKSAGFTDEERRSFEDNFLNKGFVDSFRQQHPNTVGYTYWGYRSGARADNRGWRLDYFLVSNSIADNIYDSYILPDVNGSDHCPIGLIVKF